jgi:hypothetical protein
MEHPKSEQDPVGFATLKETLKPATLSPEAQRELEHFRAQHERADEAFARDLQRVLRKR